MQHGIEILMPAWCRKKVDIVLDPCRNGDMVQLTQILASGVEIDKRDKHARTALHLAAWAGQVRVHASLSRTTVALSTFAVWSSITIFYCRLKR